MLSRVGSQQKRKPLLKISLFGGGGGVPPRQQNPNLNLRILKPRGGGVNLKK